MAQMMGFPTMPPHDPWLISPLPSPIHPLSIPYPSISYIPTVLRAPCSRVAIGHTILVQIHHTSNFIYRPRPLILPAIFHTSLTVQTSDDRVLRTVVRGQ
jgi:hypothetical protein